MINKIQYGYFRKIDISSCQIISSFGYGDILFHLPERMKLQHELKTNVNIKLFCTCCQENKLEIKITDTYGFEFIDKTHHTKDCLVYFRLLTHYSNQMSIAPLTGQAVNIPVSFHWEKGSRATAAFILGNFIQRLDGPLSLDTFLALINIRAFEDRHRRKCGKTKRCNIYEIVSDAAFELGKFKLRDNKNRIFSFNRTTMFSPNTPVDSVSFIYARILEITDSYKSKIYLLCEHPNGTSYISVSRQKWDGYIRDSIIPELPLYIGGFITTKEVTIFVRGYYDSKTHKVYNSGDKSTRIEHSLKSFAVFHANDDGLICFSREEYKIGNILSVRNTFYNKPYYPLPGIPTLPLLQIHSEEGPAFYTTEKTIFYPNTAR